VTEKKLSKIKKPIRKSWDDLLFDALVYTLLTLALFIVLYPLIFVVSSSFSSPRAVLNGLVVLWPIEPGIQAYEAVFRNRQIMIGFRNSFFYTLTGTLLNLVMGMLAAFPLSRRDLFGRKTINVIFIFTMFFSGGLVPYFLLIKETLGLYNSPFALILPGMMSVWYVILMRTYIQSSIPEELIESAELDGCKVFVILVRIIVPLSKPILAVVALYCAVGIWSSYFDAFIFIRSQEYVPLQVVLRNILILNNIDPEMLSDARGAVQRQGMRNLLKYSVIVVSSAPLLMAYPFVQKHFVKGIMLGSLKG
jgi:multiple sugar transport system permease protein/putative aldouronate transport system permease protein